MQEDIRFGDKDAIEKLMYALLLSGLCMQMVEWEVRMEVEVEVEVESCFS